MRKYTDLLDEKHAAFEPKGFEPPELCSSMFDHQRATTEFLLRAGCGAAFLDTGLGKSLVALDWGRCVHEKTNGPVLMLAPLAVGYQHAKEAEKFSIDAAYMRDPSDAALPPVTITNYERLHLWDVEKFSGIILDESSILKSMQGRMRNMLVQSFANTPYRLACTATPAPNDHMELGNHAEFLGVMKADEMLARWFVNDTSMASQKWRLKGHAVNYFWDWVASWARCISKPSDMGFSDDGFVLPDLIEKNHVVKVDRTKNAGEDADGQSNLFRMPEMSATSIHKEKKLTINARADVIADVILNEPDEPWIIWVDTDNEADAMKSRISDAVEVRGSMPAHVKEKRLVDFSEGRERVLITKPSIAGFGLNWQHCARMAFVGMSFSYESYYQAVRRCWRFGQKRPVFVHRAMAETEKAIFDVVNRKEGDHTHMKAAMSAAMSRAFKIERRKPYDATKAMKLPTWMG